ncbi:hypothetical protein Q604_UNBC14553G0001, partial [human gut metagenome]
VEISPVVISVNKGIGGIICIAKFHILITTIVLNADDILWRNQCCNPSRVIRAEVNM